MLEEVNTLINFLSAAKEPKGYVLPVKKAAKIARAAKGIKKMKAAMKVELETESGEPFTIEAMLNFLKGRHG
ncbi:hypothetical protein [Desulfurobacterium sp.]